jgi:hypothetical protein
MQRRWPGADARARFCRSPWPAGAAIPFGRGLADFQPFARFAPNVAAPPWKIEKMEGEEVTEKREG